MARDGSVAFDWAGSRRRFRLPWGGLIDVQEETGAGPSTLLSRLMSGAWRVDDAGAVIEAGLVWGGLDPAVARELRLSEVEGRPPAMSILPAQVIMAAAVAGAHDEEPGETPRRRRDVTSPAAGFIRAADLYAAGAVVGYTPAEVKQCSIWELAAAVNGWIAANTVQEGLTRAEEDELWAHLQSREKRRADA